MGADREGEFYLYQIARKGRKEGTKPRLRVSGWLNDRYEETFLGASPRKVEWELRKEVKSGSET